MAKAYIPQQGLSALMWIGVILSLVFVAIRTHVQYLNARRFFLNDYWIFFATTCHLATAIVYQIAIPPMYEVQEYDYTQPMDSSFLSRAALFLRLQFAVDFLLWTTLWAVKFSLLCFFWRLFDSVRTPVKFFWWAMCGITAGTWMTLVVLQNMACDPIRNFFTLGACSSPRDIYYSNLVFKFTVGTDIAGDILIMLIPFPLLHTLQVPPRKKYILAGIFSLPIIPIIFAVLRLVIAKPAATDNVDPVKFQLYSMLENSSAIITSCLPSLRLFVVRQGSGLGSSYRSKYKDRYKLGNEYGAESWRRAPGHIHGMQGSHTRSGVEGRSENRVEAWGLGRVGSELRGGSRTGSRGDLVEIDGDVQTQGSGESQRGIVGETKGVLVTREFSVK
ncbi:hypothetical protein BDV18DRAFT_159994 [Aspergillus unguis]